MNVLLISLIILFAFLNFFLHIILKLCQILYLLLYYICSSIFLVFLEIKLKIFPGSLHLTYIDTKRYNMQYKQGVRIDTLVAPIIKCLWQ